MISQADKKRFRAIAHHLKPVVTVAGNGLTDGVVKEIERALYDHELIKIRVVAGDRKERRQLMEDACRQTGSVLVNSIGNIAVLYKANEKPDPALSNILRARGGIL
jgi:RNA-binding protein